MPMAASGVIDASGSDVVALAESPSRNLCLRTITYAPETVHQSHCYSDGRTTLLKVGPPVPHVAAPRVTTTGPARERGR